MKRFAVLFLLSCAAAAVRSQPAAAVSAQPAAPAVPTGPSLAFELRPDRPFHWVGERGTAVLTLSPGELDLLSNPEVEFTGWTGGPAALSAAPAPAGSLRWTKPVQFDKPGTFRAETRLAAQFGHVERRGVMTIQRSLGRRVVAAPARSVVVKPLPDEGRPADFSGLVGSFSLAGSLDTASCAPGDIVNLRWELRGAGAGDLAEPPSVAPGREFKVYPPRVEARSPDRIAVSQALVPLSTNAVSVAAVSLAVFDPVAGAYRTLSVGPCPLRVEEKAPDEPPAPPDAGAGEGTSPAGTEAPAAAGPGDRLEIDAPEPARFAPAATALELFRLRAGDRVLVRERSPDGAWLLVRRLSDGASGWIPAG